MKIETLLQEEIRDEIEELRKMKVGSDEYRTAVDGVTKLVDRAIKIQEFDIELEEKRAQRDAENELKLEQVKDEKKDRIVKNILTAGGIIVPAALTVWGTCKSIEFEKEGTFTTIMGRGFINKLLPRK